MKYPKKHTTIFIQVAEYDCKQVNIHFGRKYSYWFIEPNEFAIKLLKNEIPKELKKYYSDFKEKLEKY